MKKVLLLFIAVFITVFSFAQDAADKINEANEALTAKDYAKAFELYDEAMNNLGDVEVDASINYNVGFAGYSSKNYEKAIAYFDKAIAAEANVSKSHYYKARCYDKLKDYDNTIASYEAAIGTAGDAKTDAYYYGAATAAYKGKKFDKAVELFGKCVEIGYKAETCQLYKANALKSQGKDDEYKAELEAGLEMFPAEPKISKALAKIYVGEGNELYKAGTAILVAANEKVDAGSMTTADDAYAKEVAKVVAELNKAVEVLEKAKSVDAANKNASALLDACNAQLTALK